MDTSPTVATIRPGNRFHRTLQGSWRIWISSILPPPSDGGRQGGRSLDKTVVDSSDLVCIIVITWTGMRKSGESLLVRVRMMSEMDLSKGMSTLTPHSHNSVWPHQRTNTQRVDRNHASKGIARTHSVYFVWDDVCSADLLK